jgi:two-component system, chemotaxis family, sensor kinase CheA
MPGHSRNQRIQWLPIAVAVVCTATLAALLFTGVRLAARLQSASAALQLASGLTAQPQFLRSELTLIQRGLETRTYVGNSLRALDASRSASNQAYANLDGAMRKGGLATRTDTAGLYARALALWQPLDAGLARLAQTGRADLYADSAGGSTLTAGGAALKRSVDELLAAQTHATTALESELGMLAAQLREAVVHDGQALRGLLLGGAALATLLLAAMLYFAWRAGRAAEAAAEAERQVGNLLGTVREGLFLVTADGRIGSAYSDSLPALLRASAPAGLAFEELLRPLVDDKTLQGASRYLGLLRRQKVNEELIESVNPLSQIEVSFPRPQGPAEVRYLSFSFRRARGAGGGSGSGHDLLFGAVADVTERVLLQRELEQLRSGQDSQAAMLLQLLQAGPQQLAAFLTNVEVAVRRCNALLRSPGATPAELQQKVQGVFREMHALKGEAAALGMQSFVQRAHAVEDLLDALRARAELTGDEFVPVVVKLGELLDHMQLVGSMQEHMTLARSTAAAGELPAERHGDTAVIPQDAAPAARPAGLEHSLQRLASEITASGERSVRLACEGLERVPAEYQAPVRDLCIQLVRNAIVHGIEPGVARAAAGKPPAGTVRVRFSDAKPEEYSLLVEDDGQGLDPDQIRARALERGLLDAQQAAALDRSGAFRLIFQSGFSTAAEVTPHAGRGVGLDVVNTTVRACGGRIGIATAAGKYTRFKTVFPRRAAAEVAQPSAA